MVQEHLETFLAQVETETGASLPDFVKEFDAFLECGILADGFLRLRCAQCAHEKLVAYCPDIRSSPSDCCSSRIERGRLDFVGESEAFAAGLHRLPARWLVSGPYAIQSVNEQP